MYKLFAFLGVLGIPLLSPAQIAGPAIVNVCGGSAINGYYRFDWSVGEMCLIESFSKTNIILENGFLHPGTEKSNNNSNNFFGKGDIMIFPNPAYTNTEINITLQQAGIINMQLVDVIGRVVLSKQFNYNGVGQIEKLHVTGFKAGTYFIHLVLTPTDPASPQRKGVYKLTHLNY